MPAAPSPMPPSERCGWCGAASVSRYLTVRELQLGTGESFRYAICAECGSLRLDPPPKDLAPYYPGRSYAPHQRRAGYLKRNLARPLQERVSFRAHALPSSLLARLGLVDLSLLAVAHAGATPGDRVLDVGCGDGVLLSALARRGFPDLTGVDPFYAGQIPAPVRFLRGDLDRLGPEPFDLIIFDHSLEHVPDPTGELTRARDRLTRGGRLLLRIPIAAEAFRRYGEAWFQIDAPRHLSVPTAEGVRRLADRVGLRLRWSYFDSTDAQIRISERYLVGEPPGHPVLGGLPEVLARGLLPSRRRLVAEAVRLNAAGLGDQAVFCLVRSA